MDKINRREFLKLSLLSIAGLSFAGKALAEMKLDLFGDVMLDRVKFGNSGLMVPRVAMGTGTIGSNKSSNQTRLGMEQFVKMARHAYDRGMRFYDMADSYGSHQYVAQAIKGMPRENLILQSKMWTYDEGTESPEQIRKNIDRFRSEIGTDYLDILLLHCMTDGDWDKTRRPYMDVFSRAKEDGIVKTVGVSCHNWAAMETAVNSPWVDVILARINPFTTLMDGTPEAVKTLLGEARARGKAVIGMKIFGEGRHITESERERSLKFALTEGNVDCMTIGMESTAQIDDAVERVMRIVKENGLG